MTRFFTPPSLALLLVASLTLTCIPDVNAQGAQSCFVTGGKEISFENESDVNVQMTIYYPDGTVMVSVDPILPNENNNGCDVAIGLKSGPPECTRSLNDPNDDNHDGDLEPIGYLCLIPDTLIVLGFDPEPYPVQGNGAYFFAHTWSGEPDSFYGPFASTQSGNQDTHFRYYVGGGEHRMLTSIQPLANSTVQFIEDFLGDTWVMPYNLDYLCAQPNAQCSRPYTDWNVFVTPVECPSCVDRYTFADESDVVVPSAYTWDWDLPGVTLEFPESTQLVVEGELDAEGVTMTEADPGQGWAGVFFDDGSMGTLTGVTVEKASPPCINGISPYCGAALTAYNATVTLDGVTVSDNDGAGVRASGSDGLGTIIGDSEISDNTGAGVTAIGGGDAIVGGTSQILRNGVGLLARGAGSRLATTSEPNDPVIIQGNFGPGASAELGGALDLTGGPDNPPQDGFGGGGADRFAQIWDNDGGLSATGGSHLLTHVCGILPQNCYDATNDLRRNADDGVFFDARSLGGSSLDAPNQYWGEDVQSSAELFLETDTKSVLIVDPVATTPPGVAGGGGASASARGTAPPELPEGFGGGDVAALVLEAERALAAGEITEATQSLAEALLTAYGTDEWTMAFEAGTRFLHEVQPAEVVAWLEAEADDSGDDLRPWVLRALAAAYAGSGNTASATDVGETLATDYAGTEHAARGLLLLVRLACEAEDEAPALSWLGEVVSGYPESAEAASASVLVAVAFPEADVESVVNGAVAGGRTAGGVQAMASAAESAVVPLRVQVQPNPVIGVSALMVETGAEATVRMVLYDALGREVAVLHDGTLAAGRQVLPLDTQALGLPAGVYVVRTEAQASGGTAHVSVTRFTVVR